MTEGALQQHRLEAVYDNGFADEPDWKVICGCLWETWGHRNIDSAAEEYATHIGDIASNNAYAQVTSRALTTSDGLQTVAPKDSDSGSAGSL